MRPSALLLKENERGIGVGERSSAGSGCVDAIRDSVFRKKTSGHRIRKVWYRAGSLQSDHTSNKTALGSSFLHDFVWSHLGYRFLSFKRAHEYLLYLSCYCKDKTSEGIFRPKFWAPWILWPEWIERDFYWAEECADYEIGGPEKIASNSEETGPWTTITV